MRSASIVFVGTQCLPNSQSRPIFPHRPVQRRPLSLTEGFATILERDSHFLVSSLETVTLVSLVAMAMKGG